MLLSPLKLDEQESQLADAQPRLCARGVDGNTRSGAALRKAGSVASVKTKIGLASSILKRSRSNSENGLPT
jgi:hypothetical protein